MNPFTRQRLCLGAFFLMMLPMTHAQSLSQDHSDPSPSPPVQLDNLRAERFIIEQERAAVQARWQTQDAACAARFTVTACRDQARQARESELKRLKARELALNEADRRIRTEQARERLLQREHEQTQRLTSSRAEAQPISRDQPDGVFPQSQPQPRGARTPKAVEPAAVVDQTSRIQQHHDRVEEARRHRQDVERRYQDHVAKPLPVPQTSDFAR